MLPLLLFLLLPQISQNSIRYTDNVIDVPSVKYMVPADHPCNLPSPSSGNIVYAVCVTGPEEHETCTDKTRILLHSEDGTGHCINFGAMESKGPQYILTGVTTVKYE